MGGAAVGRRATVTIDVAGDLQTGTEPDEARPIDLLRALPDELVAELAVSLKVSPDLRHETALITGEALPRLSVAAARTEHGGRDGGHEGMSAVTVVQRRVFQRLTGWVGHFLPSPSTRGRRGSGENASATQRDWLPST